MQRRRKIAVLITVLAGGSASGLSSCDGGSVGGGGDGGTGNLVAKCEQLAALTCKREVECKLPGGATDQGECTTQRNVDLGCARTRGVSATFDQCAADLGALSCASLFPGGEISTPPSCAQVLDLMPTKEQEQCEVVQSAVCDRVGECTKTGAAEDNRQGCLEAFAFALPCELASGVSATYDQCLASLKSWTCAMILPNDRLALPPECSGVILTNRSQTVAASRQPAFRRPLPKSDNLRMMLR